MFEALYEKSKTEDLGLSERLFPPASDRAYWEGILGEEELRAGEAYLGYEWPLLRASQYMEFQKSGNRMVWEEPHFARRKALLTLFLAELAEHRGRFLPDLCDGIFLICEESFWGLSAHANLPRKGELLPRAKDPYIFYGMEYALFGFGKRIGEESLCRLAKTVSLAQKRAGISPATAQGTRICDALYARIDREELEKTEELCHDRDFFLPDTQNLFLRRGAWLLGAKGGHNKGNHNHNDVANLVLYRNGTPVLTEAGYGTYTRFTFSSKHRYRIWTMRSDWHNLPTLGGEVQNPGETYCADRFEEIPDGCEISYARAYPESAGVTRAIRRLTLNENGLELRDEFTLAQKECTVTEHFLTPLTPEITKNGVKLGDEMLLSCDVAAEIEIDRKEFGEDPKLVKDHGTDHLFRIRFSFSAAKSSTITFRIGRI